MDKIKKIKIFFIFFFTLIILFLLYSKFFKKTKIIQLEKELSDEIIYKSNIIKDVNYSTKDTKGNEYKINALQGEIDFSNPNIIYLKGVSALIKLNNSGKITIISDYGKYNSENFDTIFSKNVIVNYLDNKITSDYLDFSLERNSMIVSRKVVYTNLENILNADVIEVNIETKDTKIFMHDKDKKIIIKSKN